MMVIAYQSSEFFSKICLVSLCSLIENNLNEDGSVNIPEKLRPYMGGMEAMLPKNNK